MDPGTAYDKLLLCIFLLCTQILELWAIETVKEEYDVDRILEVIYDDSSYLPLESMDLGYDFEKGLKCLVESCFQCIRRLLKNFLNVCLQTCSFLRPINFFSKCMLQYSDSIQFQFYKNCFATGCELKNLHESL